MQFVTILSHQVPILSTIHHPFPTPSPIKPATTWSPLSPHAWMPMPSHTCTLLIPLTYIHSSSSIPIQPHPSNSFHLIPIPLTRPSCLMHAFIKPPIYRPVPTSIPIFHNLSCPPVPILHYPLNLITIAPHPLVCLSSLPCPTPCLQPCSHSCTEIIHAWPCWRVHGLFGHLIFQTCKFMRVVNWKKLSEIIGVKFWLEWGKSNWTWK